MLNLSIDRPTLLLSILIACSVITSAILFTSGSEQQKEWDTSDLNLAIESTLREFQIPEKDVRLREVWVDSTFSRSVWIVDVPRSLSVTTLHYSLDRKVRPMGFQTPAQVEFPNRDLTIHLYKHKTVLQTIQVRRNTEG